jgi:hypothetical protein
LLVTGLSSFFLWRYTTSIERASDVGKIDRIDDGQAEARFESARMMSNTSGVWRRGRRAHEIRRRGEIEA